MLAAPAAAAPGPPLREDPVALAAALECSPGVADAEPVLLIHGTTSSPEDSFAWGYRKVLPELGIPACTVRLPERATVDLQRSAEYVVAAIRAVARRSPDHRVDLLGHSQGAFHAVYTLKFWPDLARKVDDAVVLAGPFAEAEGLQAGCNALSCPPPFRQRQKGAKLFGAFLGWPLPVGPSFTSILTLNDEVTRPQPASSTLPGARNVVLQDLCPGRDTEHLGMLSDAVVFQVVMDAFSHPGPAGDVTPDCAADTYPGIDGAGFAATLPSSLANLGVAGATADQSPSEPPVRCYLDRTCADVAERGLMVASARRRGLKLSLRVQAPGRVRLTVTHGRHLVRRTSRRLEPGRRLVSLPARPTRPGVQIETRPRPYTRWLVEPQRQK